MVSKYVKQIYSSPTKEMAFIVPIQVKDSFDGSDKFRNTYPRVSRLLDEHVEETLAFVAFPEHHSKKIRTTNLIEGTFTVLVQ